MPPGRNPNSHRTQNPSSHLNPNALPFNRRAAAPPHHSTQRPLVPFINRPTHPDGRIPPPPLIPVDSLPVFQFPPVIPQSDHLLFYYNNNTNSYYYPSYTLPAPPFYLNNSYLGGNPVPIDFYPQPSPPPRPFNFSIEPAPAPELQPATSVPSNVGRHRLVEHGLQTERRKKKFKKRKAARFVRRSPPRLRWRRSLPPRRQYRNAETSGVNATATTNNESSSSRALTSSEGDGKTSLMIRNIPNNFERIHLLRLLDKHCAGHNKAAVLRQQQIASTSSSGGSGFVRSEYDFVYLPMDFWTDANLGYAFVNFTTAAAASRFEASFHNYEWPEGAPGKRKGCQIAAANIQGKERLIRKFRGSKFRCSHDYYLPAYFSPPRDGVNRSRPMVVGQRIR